MRAEKTLGGQGQRAIPTRAGELEGAAPRLLGGLTAPGCLIRTAEGEQDRGVAMLCGGGGCPSHADGL